jgi:hypothetical protein
MAYGSVHIPAGCTVKIGDTVAALTDLGVLKGDASIEITYDKVKVEGSKAETLVDFVKNMKATATFEMYQLHLPNIQKLFDGAATITSEDGTPVSAEDEVIASGDWSFEQFVPFEKYNGDGTEPTINSVTGSVDGALVEDTDYYIVKNEEARWGIIILDSATVTTEEQDITVNKDYTPAASKTLDMGNASAELVTKIVELSKTIGGKLFRARLWSATNEAGLTLSFPDSAGDDPASIPISVVGGLDTDRASGKQLIEIYDEIGLTI